MSMTVVVREALCVYVGGAWALMGHIFFKECKKCELSSKGKRSSGGLFDNS